MTYKEKMMQEHPIYVSGEYLGGVKACPGTFFNGAPLACGRESKDRCTSCWNTKIPEQKKTEPKKAETPIDLLAKALESKDKSVHIRVEPDGITSVDIVPVGAFKEAAEEEPASEPTESDGWLKIEYDRDERGMLIITKNEPESYKSVHVYCANGCMFTAYWCDIVGVWRIFNTGNPVMKSLHARELKHTVTHWRPLPEAPKGE